MEQKRFHKNLIFGAALATIIGFGNLTFGMIKHSEYLNQIKIHDQKQSRAIEIEGLEEIPIQIEDSKSRVTDRQESNPFSFRDPETDDKKLRERLESRANFYAFVTLGGQVILAVAGIMILGCLVILREERL